MCDSRSKLRYDPLQTSLAESVANSFMVCGKHRRPLALRKAAAGTKSPDRPRYTRRLQHGDKRGSCVCDYTDFPELLRERQNAQHIPREQQFRLLDLPAELRTKIYEHVLVEPEGLEFCPEPWKFTGRAPACQSGRCGFEEAWRPVAHYQTNKIRERSSGAMSFRRVSKQGAEESRNIFYEKNEFRFSNTSGWVALELFMFTIGMANCRKLRKITVSHPDCTVLPETCTGDLHFWSSIIIFGPPKLGTAGIFYPNRWYNLPLSMDPKLVLEKIPDLQRLKVVIPWDALVNTRPLPAHLHAIDVIDASRFDRLQLTVVSLKSEQDTGTAYDAGTSAAVAVVETHNKANINHAWRAEERIHDALGRYGFEGEAACETE